MENNGETTSRVSRYVVYGIQSTTVRDETCDSDIGRIPIWSVYGIGFYFRFFIDDGTQTSPILL